MEIRALMSAMWRNRAGPLLVATQIALTLAVIVNVAYIVQSRLEIAARPTGMDVDNMFWVAVQAHAADYNHAAAVPADLAWLHSIPGVVATTPLNPLPQTWSSMGLPFSADPDKLQGRESVPGRIYFGTEEIVDALGLKLIAGRTFSPEAVMPVTPDPGSALAAWAPEIIVTKAMADKLFPKGDALGKIVHVGLINRSSVVVGIVEMLQTQPIGGDITGFFYQTVLVAIMPPGPNATYMVRTEPGRRDAIMTKVEKEFAELQAGRYLNRIESFTRTAEKMRTGSRASALILSVVALFVLAVTTVGIAGLAAFNVATRTKQLGTRRAIGATKFHILRYFFVENWLITSTGALVGCGLALAAGIRLSIVYQMTRLPLYYLVAGVIAVWVLGLLAVLFPARRAASISPATATRMV